MPAGDVLRSRERASLDQAIRAAETISRFEFSVFIGTADGDPRAYAERLHAALVVPDRSVLVLVDPIARALEIVTGEVVRRTLDDQHVQLVLVGMQSDLATSGDLVGAIGRGLRALAQHARA